MTPLVLFTRAGCCLCEALAEKLQALDPAPTLELVDIDTDPALQARYSLQVPVLAIRHLDGHLLELPRVPPRLAGGPLKTWLGKHLPSA